MQKLNSILVFNLIVIYSVLSFAEIRNILMTAPKSQQSEVQIDLTNYLGTQSTGNTESKTNGYDIKGTYYYGLNSYVGIGLEQKFYTDTKSTSTTNTTSTDSISRGVGDTTLGIKGFSNTEPAELYYSLNYSTALFDKYKVTTSANESIYTAVAVRNELRLTLGSHIQFSQFSFGGQMSGSQYQAGHFDIVDSSNNTSEFELKSSTGHSITLFSQIQLGSHKIGLTARESSIHKIDFNAKVSGSSISGTTSSTTSRNVALYGIFNVNPELDLSVTLQKYLPKDEDNTTYNNYYLIVGSRFVF